MSARGLGESLHGEAAPDGADDALNLAADLCPDPVLLVDHEIAVVTSNGAWHEVVGRTIRAPKGQLIGVVHEDDVTSCSDAVRRVADRREPSTTFECRIHTADGTWRWFEWAVRPDPGRRRAYLFGRDVDERTLRERQHRLLLEKAPDLLVVIGPDGDLRYRSRDGGPALPGGRPQIGERVFSGVHPEDLPMVLAEFARAVKHDVRPEPFEVRVRRPDGGWSEVEVLARNCLHVPEIDGVVVQTRDVSARHRAERTMRAREARFGRLVDAAPFGLFEIDGEGRLVFANEAWSTITGQRREAVVGQRWNDIGDGSIEAAMRSTIEGWGTAPRITTTAAVVRPDGEERWVRVHLVVDRAADGAIERHLGFVEDVTMTMRGERSGGLDAVLDATPDLVLVWDHDGRILYANGAARSVLGLARLGVAAIDDVYAPWARERMSQIAPVLADEGVWTGELAVIAATGGEIPVSQVMVRHESADGSAHVSVVARDITEQKRREADLAHRATHDPLTGLANRVLFLERLRHALRREGPSVAVAFLDLDRFKLINDSLGHEVGDQVLVALAGRLEELLRPNDMVARLGGDEFVVLCEGIDGEREALRFAERIREAVCQPFDLPSGNVFLTTSIGVAIGSGISAETLMENADVAMYRAKDCGRARCELFDAELRRGAAARLEIESALRRGLDQSELRVFYQPHYSLVTGALVGMEALVRWQHPQLGLVSPVEFIPVAEESGLIVPLGTHVLQEACRQVREWQERFPSSGAIEVHVNLSARQFVQPDLVRDVASVLREAEVAPQRLCLEITESVAMDDVESTIATLLQLRALGVKVGIDDFGTGYSSLSYLRRLPVDVLKIDKSFVARLGEDMVDSAIVSSVVNLARSLGIAVVAEGVETEQQRLELRALGCPVAQGYYFSRPLSAEAATELIASESWR
ncbi:MAG: EAL domain-containing protein [Actinomycetota bacterium]